MKIIWSPLAVERVSEIAVYIAQENPDAAERWVDAVFGRVEGLVNFPETGRIVPETNNKAIRDDIRKLPAYLPARRENGFSAYCPARKADSAC
jgi:plasmid stabilization system protein ParE